MVIISTPKTTTLSPNAVFQIQNVISKFIILASEIVRVNAALLLQMFMFTVLLQCICQKMGIDTGDRLLTNSRKRKFLVKSPLPPEDIFPPFQDFDVVHNYLTSTVPYMQARLRKRGQKGNALNSNI